MNHTEIRQRFLEAETVEQAAAVARECGMELSTEETAKLFEEIRLRRETLAESRELDMNELAAVAGGHPSPVPSVCKGSIMADGITVDASGKVIEIAEADWCWGGPDFCYYWTEDYKDTGVYVH